MALFNKRSDDANSLSKTMSFSTASMTELKDRIAFEKRLHKIINQIHSSPNIDSILLDLKDQILGLVDANRITLYAVTEDEKQIYSKIKAGEEIKEFRIPINNNSIAGYVAQNKMVLAIKDAYDIKELSSINASLQFNRDYDMQSGFRTRQVLAAPILFSGKLLGVMQLINKKSGEIFTAEDIQAVGEICETLAIAFHNQNKIQRRQLNIFDLLTAENIVLAKEIEQAVQISREQNQSISFILMNKFKVRKEDIGRALSTFYKVPFFEYQAKLPIPKELLTVVDANYLRTHIWVPLRTEDSTVVVAMDNPRALEKLDDIRRYFPQKTPKILVSIREDIAKTIDYFFGAEKQESEEPKNSLQSLIEEIKDDAQTGQAEAALEAAESEEEMDNTVVKLVNQILTDAYKMNASDIHIEPGMGKKDLLVRVRIDGDCTILQKFPAAIKRALVSRIKIMAMMDISERRKPQDGKIQLKKYGGPDIELRVATIPTVGGNEDVVLRILAASKPIPLEKLGLLERNFDEFTKIINMPYGIVLVVGPTGSGKTTSLHSALGYINKPDLKIWTAEDPVEITQEGLRQVQVLPVIGFTFATALRSFLRADPDVIMVGEMRDFETASIGIEASLTGHLVFSTLHTNSAPETIIRLLDLDIDPFNFADALLGVLAQRLVRTLCKECKKTHSVTQEYYEELVLEYGAENFPKEKFPYREDLKFYQASSGGSCQACNGAGYKGRMGIHELLLGTDTMKRMIQRKASVEEMRNQAIKDGMITLKQDGIIKVFRGNTDMAQVRSVCIK